MSTERPHGYARYKLDKCDCYVCGLAASIYRERVARAKIAGTWNPYVDAEPVRQHLHRLSAAGIGTRRAADLAGVNRSVVSRLLYGKPNRAPSRRIRPAFAERLLAVQISDNAVADHGIVDATGTQRRLHALVAAGWPMAQLARRLGMLPSNFGGVMGKRSNVTAATARAVVALYDELWDQEPTTSAASRSRAINYARARQWPPPAAWDDDTLDDPAVLPATDLSRPASHQDVDLEVVNRLCGGRAVARSTIAERRAAVRRLHGHGLNDSEIAARMGITSRSVLRIRHHDLGLAAVTGVRMVVAS